MVFLFMGGQQMQNDPHTIEWISVWSCVRTLQSSVKITDNLATVRGGYWWRWACNWFTTNWGSCINILCTLTRKTRASIARIGTPLSLKHDADGAPIHIAVELSYHGILFLLPLREVNVKMVLATDETPPLHLAVATRPGHHKNNSATKNMLTARADVCLRGMHPHAARYNWWLLKGTWAYWNNYRSIGLARWRVSPTTSAGEMLLKGGAPTYDNHKATPLHVALWCSHCDAMLILLRHKAGAYAWAGNNKAPLAWACITLKWNDWPPPEMK